MQASNCSDFGTSSLSWDLNMLQLHFQFHYFTRILLLNHMSPFMSLCNSLTLLIWFFKLLSSCVGTVVGANHTLDTAAVGP